MRAFDAFWKGDIVRDVKTGHTGEVKYILPMINKMTVFWYDPLRQIVGPWDMYPDDVELVNTN